MVFGGADVWKKNDTRCLPAEGEGGSKFDHI
jgi:hypothetical protein